MDTQHIDFEQTNAFSKLFLDYIKGNKNLREFYGLAPTIENFAQQIAEKKSSFPSNHRQVLHQTLLKQYQNFPHKPQNIEALLEENTFTITTGHQLNIFTGPAYFIYKIATTINLAKSLKQRYPQYNFVPVYWLASEDHDFAEINHFSLFNKTYQWNSEQKGAVGRFKTEGLEQIFAELPEKLSLFEQAYLKHSNLSEATHYLVNELFGEYGLVCIDADDKALKSLFAPIMKDEILSNSHQKKAFQIVKETSENLENQGFKAQVNPREINLFYLEDGLRERIVIDENTENFKVLNTDLQFRSQEIEKLITDSPEKFSPNVILRPVYQEVILPNLAYIGGPGELAYWLQLKGVFDNFKIPFPILMPRNFALVINKTNFKKFQKLGITLEDLFLSDLALKEKFVKQNSQNNVDLNQETQTTQEVFINILAKAREIDKTLEGFVGAEQQKILKSLENIEKRLQKAEEQKLDTEIKQLLGLKEKLFPQGELQERSDNFLNFYLNQPEFIHQVLKSFNPLRFTMNVLIDSEL